MRHVRDYEQLRAGLTYNLQQTHDIGVAAKLGQQLSFTEKIFPHFLISLIWKFIGSRMDIWLSLYSCMITL